MLGLIKNAKEIAKADCPILIVGETGTGKEVLSCIIHKESKRKNKPFIKVNASAIPKELFESELFGCEKGAYTSAISSRKGKISLANGGTFLLDEISEIPFGVQAKLLRAIEYGEIQRLGSDKIEFVTTRFIATTNRNLKEILGKSLREDLFYRISSITIEIPPLRERKEDIPVLFDYFLNIYRQKYKKNNINFEKDFMEKLIEYPFYGNIRELKGIAEKIVLMAKEKEIKAIDFLPQLNEDHNMKLKEAVKKFEVEYIKRVLRERGGKIGEAAKILGISRKTLYLKLNGK